MSHSSEILGQPVGNVEQQKSADLQQYTVTYQEKAQELAARVHVLEGFLKTVMGYQGDIRKRIEQRRSDRLKSNAFDLPMMKHMRDSLTKEWEKLTEVFGWEKFPQAAQKSTILLRDVIGLDLSLWGLNEALGQKLVFATLRKEILNEQGFITPSDIDTFRMRLLSQEKETLFQDYAEGLAAYITPQTRESIPFLKQNYKTFLDSQLSFANQKRYA